LVSVVSHRVSSSERSITATHYPVLFLLPFNKSEVNDYFHKEYKCKIVRKSVRWEYSCSVQTDGRTDGRTDGPKDNHDEASSPFGICIAHAPATVVTNCHKKMANLLAGYVIFKESCEAESFSFFYQKMHFLFNI